MESISAFNVMYLVQHDNTWLIMNMLQIFLKYSCISQNFIHNWKHERR